MGHWYSTCFLRWQVTKSESSEFVLDNSGKFVQYDTLDTDPKYLNLQPDKPQPHDESAKSSPTSVGNSSIGK